jgi:hypothetical protein
MSELSKNHFASVIGESEVWDFVRSLRKSLGRSNALRALRMLGHWHDWREWIALIGNPNLNKRSCAMVKLARLLDNSRFLRNLLLVVPQSDESPLHAAADSDRGGSDDH